MEKEPSFLIGICHNLPRSFSPSQGITEVLTWLILFWFGLGDWPPFLSCTYLLPCKFSIGSLGFCSRMSNPAALWYKDRNFISDKIGFIPRPRCWWHYSARVTLVIWMKPFSPPARMMISGLGFITLEKMGYFSHFIGI